MKFLIVLVIFFTCLISRAQTYQIINCVVNQPCKYSRPNGLGYCLGQVKIKFNDPLSGNYMEVLERKQSSIDILRIATEIPVTQHFAYSIAGMDSTGDSWFKLNVTGKIAFGVLTIDQDFQFPLYCE